MKERLIVPEGYEPSLSIKETEVAIKQLKDFFERELAKTLNLTRVSAPLFVCPETGMNDNLNGVERPVSFDIKDIKGQYVEIVHSLAKWKRMALGRYGFEVGEGLYTDMDAIRRDEDLDNIHSIYVDQWDWEKIITKEERTEAKLKEIVERIYEVFKRTGDYVEKLYPELKNILPEKITFITSQELEDRYPGLSSKDREHAIAKEYGAVFIMKIGGKLLSGERHDGRAPDYDDWELNGDILFWNPLLNIGLELSSMGIRVDEDTLEKQLSIAGCEDRKKLDFHRLVLEKKLPYTVGGGIGQSRICMFFLQKAHIGEVQASIWSKEMIDFCEKHHMPLL
ncbi:aspartate--ammonia ligase [Alkaliphilus oremlandii]|uniref:Aspartate--ammonia ligase n=1 Tax=Alkaliphilus oremlandii (strain OhILAs) TaxID=350688 RepID=A8MKX8_ALKOO|nr:aspartate--ammonia ligase [Alkaliphilus oremlandii]ABW17795.1 Aspartate--ammonia ligase [Alkaliphilus oremlandii OhILAs]